jgi:FkbM family methyltransferase
MLIDFRKLFPRHKIKPKGVLHLGANVGEEAQVYDQLGIKNVIWVEANPEVYQTLVMNVAQYGHRHFNFCVGDENKEEVIFHISNNGSQSSSVLELGTHKQQHPDVKFTHDIKVPMFRIDSFFSSDGDNLKDIDFLNADLQGFEKKALEGMGDLLHQFKWVYLEVNKNDVYIGCPRVEELDEYLGTFGFKRVETAKWIGDWSDAIFIKQ